VKRNPEAVQTPRQLVFRLDASLYFANVEHLKDQLDGLLDEQPDLESLILDFYPVNRIDSSAMHALADIIDELSNRGIRIAIAGVKGPVKDKMALSGLVDRIGAENFFLEVHEAANGFNGTHSNHSNNININKKINVSST
jgi:SulP family sulfate permease